MFVVDVFAVDVFVVDVYVQPDELGIADISTTSPRSFLLHPCASTGDCVEAV
ncbi:MAG: hypothetical protein AAFP20_09470 [Cyanobacteria bacterium J06614_10]